MRFVTDADDDAVRAHPFTRADEDALADFVNRSKGGIPDDVPEVAVSGAPLGLVQLLRQTGLCACSSEAMRMVDQGGVRIRPRPDPRSATTSMPAAIAPEERLAAAIAGSDVRAILAGHLHYSTSGTFHGIPVSVASATCYTMNLQRPPQEVNGMDAGQSFQLVHVYEDSITHAVVPVGEAETADVFSAEWTRRMAALSPAERLEAFSRKR